MEKRDYSKKHITKLKTPDNQTITDPVRILNEEKYFYEHLYKSKNPDIENAKFDQFFHNKKLPKLDDQLNKESEGNLTIIECRSTLKEFQADETPSTDVFTAEFYKFFWEDLCEEMVESFNFAKGKKQMLIEQRRGIITLIPKKKKDPLYLDNWRPLSLSNVDCKIVTKEIARRLEKVLPEIINEDQTGYLKERFLGENIRLINDMFHTLKANKPGIAIFLDFRKASDTIEWEFLFKDQKTFNCGSDFISWVQTFYGAVQSCVINNGHSSQMFNRERGVRQGFPLSGLLFVLCIEILAQSIKQDIEVLGIQVKGKEIEICQYAYDTTCFCSQ